MRSVARIVILGAGLAGVRTAQSLRRRHYDGAIAIVEAENAEPYNRPPLTKSLLRGDDNGPELLLRGHASWPVLQIDAHIGRRAVSLDPRSSQLELDDGRILPFDRAVIATGVQARSLPWQEQLPGVHTIRTYRDAMRLRADLDRLSKDPDCPHPRIVIIGGGFIGCEAASSIRARGLDVTVVEFLDFPLAGVLGMAVARVITGFIESAGVRIRARAAVEAVSADSGAYRITLSDGTELTADVVVVAVGTALDLDWLTAAGIATEDGVLCDSSGRTSEAGIFAVGDVARWWQPREQGHVRYEHWTNAVEQAEIVARNLVSDGPEMDQQDAVPYVWSDQFGVKLQLLGRPDPADSVTFMYLDQARTAMLAAYSRSGMVTSVLGLSIPSVVARLRRVLSNGLQLDDLSREVDRFVTRTDR